MKDSATILGNIAEGLQDTIEKTGTTQVNVFSSPARMPIVNNYVLLFYQALLQTIDDYNLTLNDLRVILKILEMMQFGNVVKLSWSDVGNRLNIRRQNMAKHIKKLKDAAILIDDEGGNTYLNPHIIAKGKFLQDKNDKSLVDILNLGAQALEGTNVSPNILTEKIKRKQREKAEQVRQNTLFDAFGKVED